MRTRLHLKFPANREETGKFAESGARLRFFHPVNQQNQWLIGNIPYATEHGFVDCITRKFSRGIGNLSTTGRQPHGDGSLPGSNCVRSDARRYPVNFCDFSMDAWSGRRITSTSSFGAVRRRIRSAILALLRLAGDFARSSPSMKLKVLERLICALAIPASSPVCS